MLPDITVSTHNVNSLTWPARKVYVDTLEYKADFFMKEAAKAFLSEQLDIASCLDADVPLRPDQLWDWVDEGVRQVGSAYRQYLAERKAGQPRRYFTAKAHALYFLKMVAPTKMADGAWLYGLTQSWKCAVPA